MKVRKRKPAYFATSWTLKGGFVVIILITAALRFFCNRNFLGSIDATGAEVNQTIKGEDLSEANATLRYNDPNVLHNNSDEGLNDSYHKTLQNFSDEGLKRANGNMCTWSGGGPGALECTHMLSKRLLHWPALGSDVRQLISKRWVFLGDSTMARLFREVNRSAPVNTCNCQFKTAPRCDMYEAFGLTKKVKAWKQPVKGLEGPIAHGLKFPHCQDCKGCMSVLVDCERFPCNETTISYMGVEFARDVEMQTELEGTQTTQESITRYLKNQKCLRHPFFCIVNTGIHDMIVLNKDGKTFIKNLNWYLTTIQPCCKHLIWIQLSAVLDDPSRPQTNSIIKVWNTKVHKLLQGERFSNWTSIVDPYNASLFWPHADNVHLNTSYYAALADLFSPFLAIE